LGRALVEHLERLDLVPTGGKVLVVNPALLTPFTDASEIAVSGPDDGTIVLANGFGSHGETVKRTRSSDGQVHELGLAGTTLLPEDRVAAELTAGARTHRRSTKPTPSG
jgi:hypothetical protein